MDKCIPTLINVLLVTGMVAAAGCAALQPTSPPPREPPAEQDVADHWGWTLLHHAVRDGDVAEVSRLVDEDSVMQRDIHDRTPLHIAATFGQPDAARVLLEAGADVHARDQWGVTPYRRAELMEEVRDFDRSEIMDLLRRHGAQS